MRINFHRVVDCQSDRDRLAGLGRKFSREKGEPQVRCEACRRWCYKSQRCNLFESTQGQEVTQNVPEAVSGESHE